jgi:AsmA protein
MKFLWPARRLPTIGLVMLGGIAAGLAVPLLIPAPDGEGPLSFAPVNAASGDSYVVTAPIELAEAPSVTLERGTAYLVSPSGKGVLGEESTAALAGGTGRIVLEGAEFRIGGKPASGWPGLASGGLPPAPIIDAISRLGFEALVLRRTTLSLVLPGGRVEVLQDVGAEVSYRRRGSVLQASGTGQLRGQPVRFEVTASLANEKKGTLRQTLPLKAVIKGANLDVTFDGVATTQARIALQGQAEVRIADFRRLARTFNSSWPPGDGLKDVRLKGDAKWNDGGIAVGKAQLSIGANEATGFLTLQLVGGRPQIAGNLAFKSLDLPPLSAAAPAGVATASMRLPWMSVGGPNSPLIRLFDADLRLSSDKLSIDGVALGRAASAVIVKDGRMQADIAELDFNGGKGNGQVSLDHSGDRARWTLRGKLDGVDAGKTTVSVLGNGNLSGRASIVADLVAIGYSAEQLAQTASGKVTLVMAEGGRIGLDLRALLAAAQKREVEGWGASYRSPTTFDKLEARFSVRSGRIVTDRVEAMISDTPVSAVGTVSFPNSRFDCRIVMGAGLSPSGQPDALIMSGAVASPRIRSEAAGQAATPVAPAAPDKRS